jgi:hypothetical protein
MQAEPTRIAGQWVERLTSLLKTQGRLHLLLNRFSGVDERLAGWLQQLEAQSPLMDPYFGDAVDRLPLLVTLTMEHLPMLDLTALIAAEAALNPTLPASSVCAWLCADVDIEQLARHLRRQLDLKLDGYERSVFFCYFDPRVMPRLSQLFTQTQLACLLGPVSLWAAPGRNGELLNFLRPDAPKGFTGLRLPRTQTDALERIDPLNAAVRKLMAFEQAVPYADDERLDAFIQQAIKLGLSKVDDQATFAALAHRWPMDRGPLLSDERVIHGLELAVAGVPLTDYLQQTPTLFSQHP